MLSTLTHFAHGFKLSAVDAAEVAAETLEDVYVRSLDPAKPAIDKPTSYLFWATRNRAIGRLRKVNKLGESEFDVSADAMYGQRYYSPQDEAIVGLLGLDSSAAQVEDALRVAKAVGDSLTYRVVLAWLDLAESQTKTPSSRDVGRALGVSHTSVNQALRRFRDYLAPPYMPSG